MEQKFLLIKILKRLRGLFNKTSIDFETLLTILTLKLTLDDRKNPTASNNGGKESKLKGMKANLLMQAILGLFMGIVMFLPFDMFYKIAMVASMDLFFMVMYMISDFSGVLLDVRDKNIIMTKPVDGSTMNAARIIHIVYYMLLMFLALNLAALVIGVIKHGPVMLLAFFIMMIFLSFLVVFLTTILYSALLERFNGEKLKDIINVFQIVLSIVTIVAYQLIGRIFEFVDFEMKINIKWWTYLLPPSWYAGLFKVIVEGNFKTEYVIMAVLSILVPIAVGAVLIKQIMPKFESYLSKLQIEDGVFIRKDNFKARLKEKLFGLVTKDHVERAFIRFTDSNLSRDRRLKLMISPNHALAFIFPFIMLLPFIQQSGDIVSGIQNIKGSMFYVTVYISGVFFVLNFEFLQYSDNFEASFIYDSFPIENKMLIMKGAMKAYYLKYVMPGMLFLTVVFVLLSGPQSILGLVLINFIVVLLLGVKVNISNLELPFSKEIVSSGNKNMGSTMAFMAICGILAGLHYFLLKNNMALSLIATICVAILIKLSYASVLKKDIRKKVY